MRSNSHCDTRVRYSVWRYSKYFVRRGVRWASAEASGEERKARDANDTLCSYSDVSPCVCECICDVVSGGDLQCEFLVQHKEQGTVLSCTCIDPRPLHSSPNPHMNQKLTINGTSQFIATNLHGKHPQCFSQNQPHKRLVNIPHTVDIEEECLYDEIYT